MIRIIAHSSNLERNLDGEYILVNELIQAAETFYTRLIKDSKKPEKNQYLFSVEFEAVEEHPSKLNLPLLKRDEMKLEKLVDGELIVNYDGSPHEMMDITWRKK